MMIGPVVTVSVVFATFVSVVIKCNHDRVKIARLPYTADVATPSVRN